MKNKCTQCKAAFEIGDDYLAFLEEISPTFSGKKFSIPPPTLCSDCRQQRRMVQVNEVNLYKRKCDLTGKEILSNFHPESPYKIYDQETWYSDQWDPMKYGRDFDFNRPFFEQYHELCIAVPHFSLLTGYQYDQNCDYTNYAGKNKNCYFIFDSDECWDCYYSYSINGCRSCADCYRSRRCELCTQCIDCVDCYGSSYLQDCENCADSMFLKNCIGCKKCLMCSNLRNKEYFVENKQVSKEAFESFRAMLGSRQAVMQSRDRFAKLKLEYPQKYIHGVQNEDVIGDYLVQCKSAKNCFDCEQQWDCSYTYQGFMPVQNGRDLHECGDGQRMYECSVCGYNAQNLLFSANCLDQLADFYYTTNCVHSSNLFGCCGLRHKEYCIFNKQYIQDEYEEMVAKIITHMQKTGEWGQFFPLTLAPFCYNESMAQDQYPLTKEDVLAKGYQWREPDKKEFQPANKQLPDAISETDDSYCDGVYACSDCGRNYKLLSRSSN